MDQKEIYNQLLEDCKSIIGESGYKQNVNTLESRWELGQSIVTFNDEMDRQKVYGLAVIDKLSKDLGEGFSTRNLHYCVQFFQKYKEHKTFCNVLQNLPEGKNTTWHDMCQKHLKNTPGTENKEKTALPVKLSKSIFNISEIEDAFNNFALDVLGIADFNQREDRWEEFKEYFIKK